MDWMPLSRRAMLAFLCLAAVAPAVAAEPGLLEKRESLYNNIFIFGDTDNVSMTFKTGVTSKALISSKTPAGVFHALAPVTLSIPPPVAWASSTAYGPSAGLPIASDLAIVSGLTGRQTSVPAANAWATGEQPSA